MLTTVLKESVKGSEGGRKWGGVVFFDCWLVVGFSANTEVLNRTRPEGEAHDSCLRGPGLLQGLLYNARGRLCQVGYHFLNWQIWMF